MAIMPKIQTNLKEACTELAPELVRIAALRPELGPKNVLDLLTATLSMVVTCGVVAGALGRT
jgi:hypothetical protein